MSQVGYVEGICNI